ncbi:MAG: acyltransferase [Gammaproteobacteria bacterium]|jgi:peptidoglycan/LPS O-acetylase OafA/YrhL|nr:acyltransferase [Gammaproteobacteria bacterium]
MIKELGLSWAWVWNSDKGVDVFFVMSGFLITGILLKQVIKNGHIDLRNFYIRRYLRLTPAYYFALTAYWIMGGPHSEWLWANYLYVSNFVHYSHQAMGWTWSLAVEEQFYFIYPLLLIVILKYFKRPGYVLLSIFLISFLVRSGIIITDELISTSPSSRMYTDDDYFNHFFTVLYDNLHTRFGSLVVGCMLAYSFHYHKGSLENFANSRAGVLTTFIGVFMLVFFMVFPIWSTDYDSYQTLHILYNIFNRNLFSLGIGIVIIATLLQKHFIADVLRAFFSSQFWYPFATLSYSLYLIHLVVMSVIIPAIVNLTLTMPEQYPWSTLECLAYGFIVSTVLSMAIATLIYLFIEKPIMNLRK